MIRAAAAALIGALAAAVWLGVFYAIAGGPRIDFAIDPPRLVSGFHGAERDDRTGLTFAWTGPEAGIRLPGLDRRVPWTLTVRTRGGKADAAANPTLTFYVDGVQTASATTSAEFQDIEVPIPPRPERRGLTLAMRSSSTFVPGPDDPRPLGVMVDALALTPNGVALPPAETFVAAMVGGAALAAAIALLGVTSGAAIAGAGLVSAGQGAVLAYGFAPYTSYPDTARRIALAVGAGLAIAAWLTVRWRGQPLRNTARFAAAFTAAACFLELLVLFHPHMPLGDALFQAHRFQEALGGNLYFTSIAPGGYAFPYAPGLYVAAAPFASFVRREMGDVALLRTVVTVADAAAGLLLYFVAARAWHDRVAAAVAVALYHLVPLGFRVVTVGNLTNAFAESLTVAALALITAPALRSVASGVALALMLALAAAFLSHTSTFAILVACCAGAAALFLWKGGPALRSPSAAVVTATLVAALLAVVLYYAHFLDTYRAELARLSGETATGAADAGGRGIAARAAAVPRYVHIYLGVPILALAAVGAADRWRRGARDRLTLAVAAWVSACAMFLLVGVLTPLDLRHYLAAIPAITLLAAAGASSLWRSGGPARAIAALLLAWAVWIGVQTWWETMQV